MEMLNEYKPHKRYLYWKGQETQLDFLNAQNPSSEIIL